MAQSSPDEADVTRHVPTIWWWKSGQRIDNRVENRMIESGDGVERVYPADAFL
ncbi:MAG: hypothetical protein ACI30S_08080 [Muribaculaceae bacterium]